VFPLYEAERFAESPAWRRLDEETRALIRAHGLRNGQLTSVAPAGTISLLAENVSSGIEPVFDFTYTRRVLTKSGVAREERLQDYAYAKFREISGDNTPLPDYFVSTQKLAPVDHLRMQAALQCYVDASISKTVNCPENLEFADFEALYRDAFRMGLKGCTAYRPNRITGSVIAQLPNRRTAASDAKAAANALPAVANDTIRCMECG
jgi:ribonucleoside-diphosphate reductase alpha chain